MRAHHPVGLRRAGEPDRSASSDSLVVMTTALLPIILLLSPARVAKKEYLLAASHVFPPNENGVSVEKRQSWVGRQSFL